MVQTAIRCEMDIDGNGGIHLLESDPCFGFEAGRRYFLFWMCVVVGVTFLCWSLYFLCRYQRQRERNTKMGAEACYRWACGLLRMWG